MSAVRDGCARTVDVSGLPTVVFSHRSLMWWGTLAMMVIEASAFALTIMAYFFLRSHSASWPMSARPPDLLWGTLNTALMLLSFVPAHLAKRAAERTASAGLVASAGTALVELNSETDFVAKSADFVETAQRIAEAADAAKPVDAEALKAAPLGDILAARVRATVVDGRVAYGAI